MGSFSITLKRLALHVLRLGNRADLVRLASDTSIRYSYQRVLCRTVPYLSVSNSAVSNSALSTSAVSIFALPDSTLTPKIYSRSLMSRAPIGKASAFGIGFLLCALLVFPSQTFADGALGVGVGTTLSSAVDEVMYSQPETTLEQPSLNLELGSIEFKNISGDPISSEAMADKKVVLFFWSLHCRGCVSMLKDLEDLRAEAETDDFELLTVHLFEQKESRIRDYVKELGVKLPILLAPKSLRELFSVRLLPASLVFDKNRKLIARFDGELTKDDLKLTLTGKLKAEKLTPEDSK